MDDLSPPEFTDGATLSPDCEGRDGSPASRCHRNASIGRIDLSLKRTAGGTVLDRSYQSGCLRLRVLNGKPSAASDIVIINTSGGLADGDRLDQSYCWGPGTTAAVITQAAEKAYRATATGATVTTRISAEAGADAEWLPQETILFDRARLTRSTEVRLAADARFLSCEAIVLGRTAMGETVRHGLLDDRWKIWRDGRLIYADALRLDGPIETLMSRAAIGGGAAAMAVILHVSALAASLLDRVRATLSGMRGLAAASVVGPILIVRLLARDGAILRHDVLLALAALRSGRPLPGVWRC